MRRQLIFIGIIVVLAAGGAYWLAGMQALMATLLGGGITLINVLLLHWHHHRAVRQARADAGKNLRILFRCAMERIVASVALFSIGLIVLKLPPLALIGGFGAALAAQYLAGQKFKT